jgi:hypothetical protein
MAAKISRRAEIRLVLSDTNEGRTFWLEVVAAPGASDEAVIRSARRAAMAQLEREGLEVSILEVSYLEPRTESAE